ncbi:glycosyltransferase [Acetobacter vaccinii]|nr:glycosyltransferase [Acetobacter vaccinii]
MQQSVGKSNILRSLSRKRSRWFSAKGDASYDQRDWAQAAEYYRKAVAISPDRRAVWIRLGHALKEAGQLENAFEAYSKASALPGDNGDAPYHMAVLANMLNRGPIAMLGFAQALREKPEHDAAAGELRGFLSENFDSNFYRKTYPESLESGMHPLIHYIDHGRAEGRLPNAGAAVKVRADIRSQIVKEFRFNKPGREAAILITHVPAGRMKPHVLPYMTLLRNAGLSVLLVVIVDRPLQLTDEEYAAADGIIVRDNGGYDFGAWQQAFQSCPEVFGAKLLVVTNDSIVPTADITIFNAMIERVRQCPADIVGLTESHEYGWHIQSYFVAFKPKALSSWAFQNFIRDIRRIDDKDEVIRTYEVPFGRNMRTAGLTVQALYVSSFAANPTFFGWRELIEAGFPFIKVLMLRKKFEESTDQLKFLKKLQKEWPTVLEKAGFDVDLVRHAIFAADLSSLPAGHDHSLLVNPKQYQAITTDHPLRIAYFGPWNYDNGLASASRELLCALHHTGVQINAYPVQKPFHIHRLLCPAVPTLDFAGQPDIAIVHLNPDSWNVLTDEQLAIIRSAKQRIGYWVWETDHLPAAWKHDLHSVDRIWSPSVYCAEVFEREVGVPVDVVPHPVRIPPRIATDRDTMLRRFGIDPKQRVILYIFDGASYLVRKNPDGLVRAFAASGLAKQGWTLVLKTKHLFDRPEAGKALTELVEQTPGARILEVSLFADEVTSLLAAADIYASPHCSEGFGLTVAEAMAVGKSVVATDYSGTKDFLDASCGYPVPSTLWTLTENHGHYLKGHKWGKIDEKGLTASLVKAATAIMRGDQSMGKAARNTIERLLSYEAVARQITASFDALVADTDPVIRQERATRQALTVLPEAPEVTVGQAPGIKFSKMEQDTRYTVIPVPLASDLSWDLEQLPEGEPTDWLFFAPHNAYVHPDAQAMLVEAANNRPDISLFYADDVAADESMLNRIRLKPDFNKTLLIAQDYIGAPVFIRRKMLDAVGGLKTARGTAMLYDLVLRVAEAGGGISRILHIVLAYRGERPVASLKDRLAVLQSMQAGSDIDYVPGMAPELLMQRKQFKRGEYPAVSIVVPTRRTRSTMTGKPYVEELLEGIAKASWPMDKVTVIVGDDVSGEPDWAKRRWPFTLRRIETVRPADEAFNYAAKMNRLWRTAKDEHIVFMNDDSAPVGPNWLEALMTFASDASVGGVGVRLYYEDGSIQHAGMVPVFRTVAHAWLNWPADATTYQDWAVSQREWSMVTGAVFATRRAILEQLNGFDERFSLEFNDVDLCLRIRNLGYRIVYNPDAQFTHAEKASRGETIPPGAEVALFLSRWSRWLDVDPASHPGLAKDRLDIVAVPQHGAWYN